MGLTPDDLRSLLVTFEDSSWTEMTVTVAGDRLHVSRRADGAAGTASAPETAASPTPARDDAVSAPATPLPLAAPPVPTAPLAPARTAAPSTAPAPEGTPVLAPSVGLFWWAPSPGAPPFVEVGSAVAPETTVGIVEVMKLMNRVPAGIAGVVTAVLVGNGDMVEHGQPLVLIEPAA